MLNTIIKMFFLLLYVILPCAAISYEFYEINVLIKVILFTLSIVLLDLFFIFLTIEKTDPFYDNNSSIQRKKDVKCLMF